MILREEICNDRPVIRQLIEAAFGQAAEADLVETLRQSGDAELSLVAADADGIAGHILFSKLQAPDRCLALAPVSVVPGRQNQGIGTLLIREGLARAAQNGWRAVFVLGDPDYYERFGFCVDAAEAFETEYPKAYFMALGLAPNGLEGLSGPIIYPRAFDALS